MNLVRLSLRSRIILRLALGAILIGGILFIPAGSLRFWQGWVLMAIFFVPTTFSVLYFCKHDPQLVERRLQTKEKIKEQRNLVRWLKPLFFAAFLIPGLDYRWGWSRNFLGGMPMWVVLLSQALVLSGILLAFWVLKVNSFASRTIQVEPGQRVISAGPYRAVRQPMYLGSLVMFLSIPPALGSYFAWPAFALLIPFYVLRLLNEESVLR